MSRIDEALKRVSTDIAEPRAVFGPGDRPARRDENVLEHYPVEGESRPARDSWSEGEVHNLPEPDSLSGQVLRKAPVVRQPSPVRPAARRLQRTAAVVPADAKLVAGGDQGVYIEQYRRLVGSLHELQVDRGLKSIMVTSALPKEGKTLTVVNVALTLSNSYGRRVLLIDADLRRPTIHLVLGLENATGLNDVLATGARNLPVTHVSPQLDVLTAGRSTDDPLEALTSDRMQALLEDASAAYDWVLLDAPPVGIMPDASLLAGMIGASLLVIAAGSTPYQLVERVVAEIGRDRIVGTVLNRIEDRNIPATGYYSDYYAASSTRK